MRTLLLLSLVLVLAKAASAQDLFLNRLYDFENDQRLEGILTDYIVVEGDVSALSQHFRGGAQFIRTEKGPQFELSLEQSDILANDYQLLVDDGSQVTTTARRQGQISTYKGYSGDHRISLTTAPNFLQGRLTDENGVQYYIEPARTLIPEAPSSSFIVYKTADALADENAVCGYTELENRSGQVENHIAQKVSSQRAQRAGECLNISLAIGSAHDMYVLRGSSVSATEAFIVAIINDMDLDFETVFDYDVNFTIAEQFVSTSTSSTLDVALGTDDLSTALLNSFATWAEGANGFTASYDLGNIWTARDIYSLDGMGAPNYGVIGTAWRPGICNSGFNYAVFESFSTTAWQLRVLQSHETGHNFDMVHDQTVNPNIMWPSVLNTTTWTSGSIAQLTGRVDGSSCLNSATLPLTGSPYAAYLLTGLCKNQDGFPFDLSARNPTSYAWTSTGATITNGSTASPTISYNTIGTKSLTLAASNANCGGAAGTETKTLEVVDEIPPTVACTISNTNSSTAGTFNFGLLNTAFGSVNHSTGYPDVDGAYSDFTCQEFATVSSLSVPFSFTVGSNGTHRLKVFIDVNNDGIFAGSEEYYNNSSVAAGSTVTPTIVLPGSTLTNTLLRVRVSCALNNRDACTVPAFGEVEDYGLINSAPLPVEMTSISTNVKESGVSVIWGVAQEIDVNHYLIEHSRDSRSWTEAGQVEATNTVQAKSYAFAHGKQAAGIHYYRVTSVDYDGSKQTSDVIAARVNDAMNGDVALAPNPTQSGWSTLSISRSFEAGSLSILDGLGRQLSRKRIAGSTDGREVLLDLTGQPKGTYWVTLEIDGNQTTLRLIK